MSDESALVDWAEELANLLPDSLTIALVGPLGAGKTRLVQALASALGVPRDEVTSPTFVICQHYAGRMPIRHVDLYRVTDEDEFWELGADEWFADPGLTLIEWADRYAHCLPPDHVEIRLAITGPTSRELTVVGRGPQSQDVVRRLAWSCDIE